MIKPIIISKEFICSCCGDKTVKHYKGLLFFGRFPLSLFRIYGRFESGEFVEDTAKRGLGE